MTEDPLANDALALLYNQRLVELAARTQTPRRLDNPAYSARAVSPICGSDVTVDIDTDAQGRITGIGYAVEACALTRTSMAVLAAAALGKTAGDVAAAGEALRAMLQDGGSVPSGDWAALGVLAPARDYRARHNAILLPFEAVEKAFAAAR